MPITYRNFVDTRDGQVYPCVLMPDGKWWSAKNLAWDGAGVYYNNDPANGPVYGKLYSWAEAQSSCPSGTYLPSDAEWTVLENAIPEPDGTKLKANSTLWTVNTGTDVYGFSVLPGGYRSSGIFAFLGSEAYFWSASGFDATRSYKRSFSGASGVISGGVQNISIEASVRFIVDEFPVEPTKITGSFSGSGVRAFFYNYISGVTVELPLSSQSTTSLTVDASFITTWGPYLGNVRILVVDGEYISDWKDWNFKA